MLTDNGRQTFFDGFGMSLPGKISESIKLLQDFEADAIEYSAEGYYLCFSGGKDSIVIKDLAIKSGVAFTSNYSVTTIDPPELTRFIKHHHPDVIWHRPKIPLLKMVEKKGLPTRRMRWCCSLYKEQGGHGLVKIMGVRSEESPRRAKRWSHISAWKGNKGGWVVNPILDWTTTDVWDYIYQEKMPYCTLYDEGFKRIGCIGCPMTRSDIGFKRWPHFKKLWRNAARKRWAITNLRTDLPPPITHPDGLEMFAGEGDIEGVYSHNVWRKYASPVWMDIRQSVTLNRSSARTEQDEKHICPLQLDTIERCLTLWSASDDVVLSPFAGIGSEGYMSVKMGRKFIGFELKPSYYQEAVKNLERIENAPKQLKLF